MKNRKFLWSILILVVMSAGYVYWVEPNLLVKSRLSIPAGNSKHSIRILYFADLHIENWNNFYDRLLNEISAQLPDVIFFGGDALSKNTNVQALERFFKELVNIAPVYAIFGNWEDNAPIHMIQRYQNLGIHLIEKDTLLLSLKGQSIAITGLQSHYFIPKTQNLSLLDSADWKILLIHAPNQLENYDSFVLRYDIVLAGHTHGGQFFIPYLTRWAAGFFNMDAYYFRGKYLLKNQLIYVSRGVGQWLPGRLFSPPEIVTLTLPIPET